LLAWLLLSALRFSQFGSTSLGDGLASGHR
jgi:hypothetical protein